MDVKYFIKTIENQMQELVIPIITETMNDISKRTLLILILPAGKIKYKSGSY